MKNDCEQLRALVLRIATMFNLNEGETDLIKAHNYSNLVSILQGFFKQISPDELGELSEDEVALLREHGFKTEEEDAVALELKDIGFEAYVTYIIFRQTKPFTVFDVMMNANELYKGVKGTKLPDAEAMEQTLSMMELYSNKTTPYVVEIESGLYDLNPMIKIGGY